VEKPKTNPPSDLAVIGRYIFTPEIFQCLESVKKGVGGEIQLTDAIKGLLAYESVIGKVISGDRYDIGKLDEYVQLMNILSKDNN
jgi:UTP--glucose-1-phosphate uridylyltransferase